MLGIGKELALFSLGGGAYVGLELLCRGRSHGSMFLAGGSCFVILGKLGDQLEKLRLPGRAMACAGIITAVELATGLVFNRDFRVWDYRGLPGNFRGQICLPFSLLWAPLGLAAMELYTGVNYQLERFSRLFQQKI